MSIEIGDIIIAFDSQAWLQAGGDQPDGNAQFWKPAQIRQFRRDEIGRPVADLFFLADKKRSNGHFVSELRKLNCGQ